jgi:TetR/AcrR family transcriptional repressor of nem operon
VRTTDPDVTQSSRARFIAAARELFLRHGYDGTSTAQIAREAGSAETQMIRLFGGKAGLLEAVFNESWKPLNEKLQALAATARTGREAILKVLSTMIAAFGSDPNLAFLMLLEERRVRGDGREVAISRGLIEFSDLVESLIVRGQHDGSLAPALDHGALRSALMGAAEAMIRDRAIARREGRSAAFSRASIRTVFEFMLGGISADS